MMLGYGAGEWADFVARQARYVRDTVDRTTGAVVGAVVGAVLDRIDLDAVVARVDVNGIAARVDVNGIADRVDVERVIARIDLVGLTRDVLHEIDLGRIVRDTGGGMAADTGAAIRLLGRRGDRGVNRLADRALRRAAAGPDAEAGGPDGPAR
ncbi:hypothetical protein OKJ48_06200 [Streptomyces kunmingensis]|uniref:Asp23/Gls24 family envelope stress response protein n=1 Tax=Streptomyces kunmingensis TaxID=68225 RepID=A0ABU6C545_9ACTN|nr:hypothetical protein [Streptomyces kunmingensis]MEB3959843.1 hypothetical protein [Streptomyces kunmingensis]